MNKICTNNKKKERKKRKSREKSSMALDKKKNKNKSKQKKKKKKKTPTTSDREKKQKKKRSNGPASQPSQTQDPPSIIQEHASLSIKITKPNDLLLPLNARPYSLTPASQLQNQLTSHIHKHKRRNYFILLDRSVFILQRPP